MASPGQPVRATEFYTETVLPALAERLDQAFPEFGWRRDPRGWVATNEEFTHTRLGVRPERVVAHGPAPRGFLIHGGEAMLWTAYLNGGAIPFGQQFIRTVEELAQRADVDPTPIHNAAPRDRKAELLETFFVACKRELVGDRGSNARSYLEGRGMPPDAIATAGIGLVPPAIATRRLLDLAGFHEAELAASGIFADSRWPGRLCGAWRTEHGRIGTLWTRTLESHTTADAKYLYLRGASRTNLPPYGLSDVLSGNADNRRDLVLVEGVLDLHQLRAHGINNVAALGGTAIAANTFERLQRLGIETVTLCLDNDDAGRTATARAVEQAARARRSPDIYVIDPDQLAPAKDPDELVRTRGPQAVHELMATRECGISWRASALLNVTRESPEHERRNALLRAGRWLGSLPPRLALEQEDAIGVSAECCGYSAEAAARTFRARFWTPAQPEQQTTRVRTDEYTPGLER